MKVIKFEAYDLNISVFKLSVEGPANEELEEEDISAASHWVLPAGEPLVDYSILSSHFIVSWCYSELQTIFSFLGNGEKIVCEIRVLFGIAYIKYTIGL